MKAKYSLTTLLLIISSIFLSCYKFNRIEGNHHEAYEQRTVLPFNEVRVEGNYNVLLSNDSLPYVSVEAEENLLPFIETIVSGNILVIRTHKHKNLKNHSRIIIRVKSPSVNYVCLSGSGEINSDSLFENTMHTTLSGSGNISLKINCISFNADISGSGEINVSGTADETHFKISGSGNINGFELNADSCYSDIDGSGNIHTSVNKYLDANISGSGEIYYYGNPVTNIHVSGSGKVIHKQ